MHPIEQLRYVARSSGAEAGLLVREAVMALSVFRSDRAGLLVASKRLLDRQPSVGPLWWMTTRLVLAADPLVEASIVLAELEADRTPRELAHALAERATVAIAGWPEQTLDGLSRRGDVMVLVIDVDGQGHGVTRRLERGDVAAEAVDGARMAGVVADADVVIVEAAAVGDRAALVDVGAGGLAATAHSMGKPVWLVCGVGRRIAEPYWQELVQRSLDLGLPPWLQANEVISLGLVDRVVDAAGVHPRDDWDDGGQPPVASELLGRSV